MLKKLFYVGLVTSTLFAQEEIITPKIEMKLTLNDNAKLLVDCSYTEEKKFGFIGGIFASKKYANDENDKTIRSLMNIVCKDTYPEMREVSLKDLYKAAKTVQADTGNPDKVTEVINKYTHSYESRSKHFNSIKHLIS